MRKQDLKGQVWEINWGDYDIAMLLMLDNKQPNGTVMCLLLHSDLNSDEVGKVSLWDAVWLCHSPNNGRRVF